MTKKVFSFKYLILTAGFFIVGAAAISLLGEDCSSFLKWWLASFILGIGFYPVSTGLFSAFSDRGWIFSKVLGTALGGFICWVVVCAGAAEFRTGTVVLCTLIPIAVSWVWYIAAGRRKHFQKEKKADLDLILLEELLFLSLFLIWTYFAGFKPEAFGTEKFMDYGYMAALFRDSRLPAADMWYAGKRMNYYYGGQYIAVFLTRLSFTRINEGYNLARTLVAAYTFVMPCSLLANAFAGKRKSFRIAAGLFAGGAVSLAGNVHYVIYGLLGSVFKPKGYETYWFPNSTRYIGHNPPTNDPCIHEFPSYSFVLGDLHAHMVNLMFVLLLLAVLFAFLLKEKEKNGVQGKPLPVSVVRAFLSPYIWTAGFLIGFFRFTNYWDYVIYLTAALITFLICCLGSSEKRTGEGLLILLVRAGWTYVLSAVVSVPFTSRFETMVNGFGMVRERTPFYQLAILWGLPVCAIIIFFIFTVIRCAKGKKEPGVIGRYLRSLSPADTFMLIAGFCAIGLVLLPELIYARDIYEASYPRSNTMFKLTYQAFVLFGISMVYAAFSLVRTAEKRALKEVGAVLLALIVLTCGYFPYSVSQWFGNTADKSRYEGLDAAAFLPVRYPSDAEAISWLNENITGVHTVLETDGDSYSTCCRVSAFTGLPTVLGWYVHEWLWRSDPVSVSERSSEVREIYTSSDEGLVRYFLEKYGVEYIFVGSSERESYPEINEEMLLSLGEVVFAGKEENSAYIIRVSGGGY